MKNAVNNKASCSATTARAKLVENKKISNKAKLDRAIDLKCKGLTDREISDRMKEEGYECVSARARGIRSRATVRREQRERLGKWAFNQLRAFIEYKAKLMGVPVLMVDPKNTSRRSSKCGHVEKRTGSANRSSGVAGAGLMRTLT